MSAIALDRVIGRRTVKTMGSREILRVRGLATE